MVSGPARDVTAAHAARAARRIRAQGHRGAALAAAGVRVPAAPGSAPYATATCASSAGGSGPPPGSGLLPGAGAPPSDSLTVDDVRRPCRQLPASRTASCHDVNSPRSFISCQPWSAGLAAWHAYGTLQLYCPC